MAFLSNTPASIDCPFPTQRISDLCPLYTPLPSPSTLFGPIHPRSLALVISSARALLTAPLQQWTLIPHRRSGESLCPLAVNTLSALLRPADFLPYAGLVVFAWVAPNASLYIVIILRIGCPPSRHVSRPTFHVSEIVQLGLFREWSWCRPIALSTFGP